MTRIWLYRANVAGHWNGLDNEVEEKRPDGTVPEEPAPSRINVLLNDEVEQVSRVRPRTDDHDAAMEITRRLH
jgi:hypothetical protein